jgi:hemerythrin-like domain-containing protein
MKKVDLFTQVHKALRLTMYETGRDLQRLDCSNSALVKKIIAEIKQLLSMMNVHGNHEDNLVFINIERHTQNGKIKDLYKQHYVLNGVADSINDLLDNIERTWEPEKTKELCLELNSLYNEYLGLQIKHLNDEEKYILPLTFEFLNDKELAEIRVQIQKSYSEEEYRIWIAWFIKALSIYELTGLIEGIKHEAPTHVFESIIITAKEILTTDEFEMIVKKAN